MSAICVIAGITASGKTKTAVQLAHIMNAEIISADSVAVYKEFNIGSAKPSLQEQDGIKHHLVDIISYTEGYSVAQFQKQARACIADIQARNKNVIIVGGTGLYLKALLYNYRFDDEVQTQNNYEDISNEVLYNQLMEKDESIAHKLHPNNRKRVIRALNAVAYHDKTQEERTLKLKDTPYYDAKVFFLSGPREYLYERINQRVAQMFKNGLYEEVETLYKQDPNFFSYQSAQAIGYREFKQYFQGNISLEAVKEMIQKDTRQFAKRQWTWFKNQMPVEVIDITSDSPLDICENWYKREKTR